MAEHVALVLTGEKPGLHKTEESSLALAELPEFVTGHRSPRACPDWSNEVIIGSDSLTIPGLLIPELRVEDVRTKIPGDLFDPPGRTLRTLYRNSPRKKGYARRGSDSFGFLRTENLDELVRPVFYLLSRPPQSFEISHIRDDTRRI